ncbi:fimbria/pilus periplasmic chaperone, partial [Serratia marcescens]|uniref:fimbria/pilus periplasmic chaperone n=1 Tax=Serratia marcescens TaxID=615 RepID=UPI0011E78655
MSTFASVSVTSISNNKAYSKFRLLSIKQWNFSKSTSLVFGCLFAFAVTISLISAPVHAGLTVGGTRVVFFGNKKEVPLTVTNSENSSAYLIRSWIEST